MILLRGEKRSETFEITGPRNAFAYSVNSLIEVTVAYPYGTIEIDSIARFNAPYEIRIADGSEADTAWVEIINDNPAARPLPLHVCRHAHRRLPD